MQSPLLNAHHWGNVSSTVAYLGGGRRSPTPSPIVVEITISERFFDNPGIFCHFLFLISLRKFIVSVTLSEILDTPPSCALVDTPLILLHHVSYVTISSRPTMYIRRTYMF